MQLKDKKENGKGVKPDHVLLDIVITAQHSISYGDGKVQDVEETGSFGD
jgi:hypothetical protein